MKRAIKIVALSLLAIGLPAFIWSVRRTPVGFGFRIPSVFAQAIYQQKCASPLLPIVSSGWQFSNLTNDQLIQWGCIDPTGNLAIGKTVYVAQPQGTDFCPQITAALNDLPANGGIVNATSVTGQSNCNNSLTIGSSTQTVQLLLGNIDLGLPSSLILMGGSEIKGIGAGSPSGGFTPVKIASSELRAEGGWIPGAVIQFENTATQNIRVRDIGISCSAQASCTGVNAGQSQDFTEIRNVQVYSYTTNCIDLTGATSQAVEIANVTCLAAATASATSGITMTSTGDYWTFSNINVTVLSGGSQQTAGISCNGCHFDIRGGHFENMADGILLTGAGGAAFIADVNGLASTTNVVHIDSSWTGAASIFSVEKFTATNSLKNDIAAISGTCTDARLGYYMLSSSINSPLEATTNCSTLPTLGPTTFANLGTPSNGKIIYCSNCTIANPCAGAGTGAIAKRLNGVWVCN